MRSMFFVGVMALACSGGSVALADASAPALLGGLEPGDAVPLADDGLRGRNYYTNLNPAFNEDRIVADACRSRRISWRNLGSWTSCTGDGWFSRTRPGDGNFQRGFYVYTHEVRNLWGETYFRKY